MHQSVDSRSCTVARLSALWGEGSLFGRIVHGVDVDGSWDGEDRSVVETRDSGRQREKPKKPLGRELE